MPFEDAKSTSHAHLIPDIPAFDDYTVKDLACAHPGQRELLIRRWNPETLPRMRGRAGPTSEGGIAFLNHLLQVDVDVGASLA
jgi:hypothetical protein